MERFRMGHASHRDWRTACDACLDQAAPLPSAANLGFLYLSDHFATEAGAILDRVRAATGIEHWVGTGGVGVCATGREYFDEPAIVMLAASYPEGSFHLFDLDERGLEPCLESHRGWLEATPACFGIVHGDPRDVATIRLLPDFAEATEAFLVGGLTSSQRAYPQIVGGITEGGLSGVLFSADVEVATGLTQGCSPLGPVHEVTACRQNVAVGLDGRPALEVLKEDVGEVLARDLRRIEGYIFAALPVEGSDQADYLVRNIMGLDTERGLVAIGDLLEEGTRLMFCRRDRESAAQDLRRMLADIQARAPGPARGAIYCSCLARGPNMFDAEASELSMIAEALGDLPLVGFFGNGEFSHNRLYTYTGVLTLFL